MTRTGSLRRRGAERDPACGDRRGGRVGGFEAMPELLVFAAQDTHFAVEYAGAAPPAGLAEPHGHAADDHADDHHAERHGPGPRRSGQWWVGHAERVEINRDAL